MAAETENKAKGFKRINFFKGFLTTEHDWNDAERYHIEKRRLHNRLLHAPGVVFGYGGDLKAVARARGDLSVEVQAGYAVDGQGRDLMMWDAEIKTLVLEEYKLPQTIYIVLRYYEQETDFIAYKENAAYKGHRRILEAVRSRSRRPRPISARRLSWVASCWIAMPRASAMPAIPPIPKPTRSTCALFRALASLAATWTR